jgi:glycosyltransferase involved in cell wall biosynthesis
VYDAGREVVLCVMRHYWRRDSQMKVVLVNDVVYAYASGIPVVVGGAERQQWLLARALAAAGWSVTVGVRQRLDVAERRCVDGVEFVGIGEGPIICAWYRFLATERPDWWYWRCADHLWGPAVTVANMVGARTIFSAGSDRDVHPRQASFRRPRWWLLYAWGLSRTDRILVQHEGQRSQLAYRWRSKSHIVPSIAPKTGPVQPHSDRPGHVAWAGDLKEVKRPDLLIEIARKATRIHFVVCGDPAASGFAGYGERIVSALESLPNVEYLGVVSQEKADQVIANAAMLLSTSDSEGFPNTFLQAWSSGTPVVSLRVDPGNVIERMGLGILSKSVDATIADLRLLAGSPQLREEIGARARQHVARTHTEEVVTQAFARATH